MSTDLNCPFCDASDTRFREGLGSTWQDIYKMISNYFSNFTLDHFNKLCDSCFKYTHQFCQRKKSWLANETQIHKKRTLGQFKGLLDIVNLKKKSCVICRLCFKGSPSEEVIFIYQENQNYQPKYIQNLLLLHANNIDLNLTENPVICQECFDGIQTFDALYQMCLDNQAAKVEPDLKVRTSDDSEHIESSENDTEKIVHVQLKKSRNNSLVLHPVTEVESAVNSLMSNRGTPENPVILNGWTTKKVIDLVQNPKSTFRSKIRKQDACVMHDENGSEHNEPPAESIKSDNDHTGPKKPRLNSCINENEKSTNFSDLKETLEKHKNSESSKSDIIEIDDSDEDEIVIPSILNITTFDESEESMGVQQQMNPGDTEFDQDIEAIPTIEINMTAVSQLFSNDKTEFKDESLLKESSCTDTDMEGSEATSVDDSSDSNTSNGLTMQSKITLKENLSDLLLFNKNYEIDSNSHCLKKSYQLLNNDKTSTKTGSEIPFNKNDKRTFSLEYERFLLNDSDQAVWKLLRGLLLDYPKNDGYCSWFPFHAHTQKSAPSAQRKCYMTALENRYGVRIYRCNICLSLMEEESVAKDHKCPKFKGRRRMVCSISKCKFYTYNDFLFSQHVKAHTSLSYEALQEYKCRFCEFFSADKKCMEIHTKTHVHVSGAVEISIPKCTFCFFESPNPDILAHHISVRHSYNSKKKRGVKKKIG